MIRSSEIWPRDFSAQGGKPHLFQGLSETSLQKILESSTLKNFKKDKLLVQQGDEPTCVYFIVDGNVRTLRANIHGDEATIRMLEVGETCMDAVIFMGCPSPITVQTASNARLMMIPGSFVKNFIMQDHQFAANLLKIVTYHYKNAMHQIDAMAIKIPVQRVGYYLLEKHMEQGPENMEFELPFKKSMIANHLGMTPETFSRALTQIKKRGVEIEGERVRLKDAYALCHFCDSDTAHNCIKSNIDNCPDCPAKCVSSH